MNNNPFSDLIPKQRASNPFADLVPNRNPYNDEGASWSEEPQAIDPWLPTPQRNAAFVQQAQQPKPSMSLTDRAIDAYTRAANDPGGAFFGAIGRVGEKVGLLDEGEEQGTKFGRALVNSLGPLGVEFSPLGSVPRTQAARPLPTQPMPRGSVRTTEELRVTGGNRRTEAKKSESVLAPEEAQSSLARFRQKLDNDALDVDPDLHPTAAKVLPKLEEAVNNPEGLTLRQLHALRQKVENVIERGKNSDGSLGQEAKIGVDMKSAVDDMISKHPEGAKFQQGTNELARSIKSKKIEDALKAAERSAQWQRGDHAGAIRNAVKPLLNEKRHRWTKEERKALEAAHRMTLTEMVGGLGATTPGRFTLGRIFETLVGAFPGALFPVGFMARQSANAAKTAAMQKAAELVRAGGPVAEGRLNRISELFTPKVFEHLMESAEGAKRIAAWAINPSPQTARALAAYTAQSVRQPDLAARILAELQGTEQGQAQE